MPVMGNSSLTACYVMSENRQLFVKITSKNGLFFYTTGSYLKIDYREFACCFQNSRFLTIRASIGSNRKFPNLEPPNLWKIEPRTYRTGVWIFKFKPNLLRPNLEPLIFLKNFLCDIHWAKFLANFFNNIERSIIISRLIHRKMFPFQSKNLWKISPIVLLQKSPNLTKFHVKKVRKGSPNL